MLQYTQIDPVAIAIGPLKVHWYGLMYVVGMVAAWWLGRRRAHRLGFNHDDIGDLIFYGAVGVILGGRIGYALVYGLDQLLANPLWLFKIWEGGMSFHGGVIGVLIAIAWVAWRGGLNWLRVCDYIAVNVPFGMMFGRLEPSSDSGAAGVPSTGLLNRKTTRMVKSRRGIFLLADKDSGSSELAADPAAVPICADGQAGVKQLEAGCSLRR